jgi:hypothetical protein
MQETGILEYLESDDEAHKKRWHALIERIGARFGREPDIEALLFLIGVHSVGRGYEPELPKERKQSLIMEGSYLAFETLGVYSRAGMEPNGFWIWEKVVDLPAIPIEQQERLLQIGILNYFDEVAADPSKHVFE